MSRFAVKAFLLLSLLLEAETWAYDYNIDNTCNNCPRRQLDSLNVYARRVIRVNQVGFRPQDSKKAMVANPTATTFRVINAETGVEASSGSLASLGTQPHPPMWVNGAFNSITSVYMFGDTNASAATESLYQANFNDLTAPGRYYIVVGKDTSATFRIDDEIFNSIFETSLKFFGSQRCGDTHSWIHGPCHMKDGSAIGHDLTGGWHDCGDHFKVSETLNYAAFVLTLTYTLFPEKAEDHYGASYNDTLPFGADGIPDLLYEAKVGADFIFKLYKASKADGLIAKHDMYHSVGVASADHQFWDVPEHQDAQPAAKGGPDRVVAKGIGGNVAGGYAATLAFFSYGWELFDKPYADSLKAAAIDMYDNIVFPNRLIGTSGEAGFYTGGNSQHDDFPAAAALALFYVTKDPKYYYDLLQNKSINDNATNAFYNTAYFSAGYFGSTSGFYPGGWMTDYQNIHSYVMYSFAKLILPTTATAAQYGINAGQRDSLLKRTIATLRRTVNDGSNGAASLSEADGQKIHYDEPYHDVWNSSDWGFNRYNLGAVVPLFMVWDLTGDQDYFNIGIDNYYYNMGMNPWDISFIMGAGDKNLQHPHNRAANPDGYNAGGFPYTYKCPKGALMGGAKPSGKTLKDDWSDYTSTETCIDFSSQIVLPSQMLAKDLPPDVTGPVLSNVVATPISNTSVLISWQSDELSQTVVYLSKTANGALIDSASHGLSKSGSVEFDNLTPGATYYFYLQGTDIRHNVSVQDNHGDWYSFVMTATPAQISSVRICRVDDQNASIYWWTSNTPANSTIKYGTSAASLNQTFTGDQGQPVLFHDVELTGLQPGTTYYFDVVSGSSTDNNGGSHYTFTTNANPVYLNYSVYMKAARGTSTNAYFEFDLTNNESKAYQGLEVRWYFSTQTIAPSTVVVHIEAPQRFGGSGTGTSLNVTAGTPVQVAGTNQWYIPFTLLDTIEVSGRAHFNFQVASFANYSNYGPLPYSELTGAWSIVPHTAVTDPIYSPGIDLAMGLIDKSDDQVETINGKTFVTYVSDPYVSLYYKGSHIFGYPPDYASGNAPVQRRDMHLIFTSPFATPQVSSTQQTFSANFAGSGWVKPTGVLNAFELDGLDIGAGMTFPISTRTDTMAFAHSVSGLNYGPNREEFVVWHNANANKTGSYECACAYQRLLVQVDTVVTPKVKRLLKFVPADTVKFYQGKRRLVTITLTDSSGATVTGEDISFALAAVAPGFSFYADPTVTTQIQSVTLQNGVAQFYVGYEQAITINVNTYLLLKASNPKTDFNYVINDPLVIVEPPPPWPIIQAAKMIDTDCNQVPDAIDIQLNGNFQVGNYDFSKVTFVYEGDTLTTTDTSNTTASSIRVHFKSPSGAVNTNPSGPITLYVNVAGKGVKSSDETYHDGIGPTVISVSILEKSSTASNDSLFIQYSEPVSASTAWPFLIYNAQGNAVTDTPTVVSAKIVNDAKNIWAYEISSSASGKQPITEGVQVQLKNGAPVVDRNGNTTDACSFAKLRVSIKRRPIPIAYAMIADTSGDGIADHVEVTFASAVDALHQPDSLFAIFGFFAPETLSTATWTWKNSNTIATLTLPRPFKLGNTAGQFKGTYQGGQLVNAGQVTQQKGLGADYEASSIIAEDKTGPIILSAVFGEGRLFDTLHVSYSEPITLVSDTAGKVMLLRERGGSVALLPSMWKLSGDGTSAIFLYTKDATGFVTEGDRVRFDPAVSRFTDVSGNAPSVDNPWVTVRGTGTVGVTVDITMQDAVNKTGDGSGYGNYKPKTDEPFRITFLNSNGTKDIWKNGKIVTTGIDTMEYRTQGPTFLVSLGIPRGSGFGDPPVWDSVQVNMEILVYSNLGGYVNKIKQSFTLHNGAYYDNNNEIQMQVEWTNQGKGPVSEQGRSVGSGAFVGRAEFSTLIFCNKSSLDPKVRARFNHNKSSQSSTWLFGYSRKK